MSKYEPLTRYLSGRDAVEVPMSFREIEQVIGAKLPASKQYPAWWSNNPSNNVMTKAWLNAGYATERVDIAGERLVFRRTRRSERFPRAAGAPGSAEAAQPGILERIRARLGGTVTIATGVDITAPTGEVWDAER